MSFRRIPFQFSTTDPTERQRELEKRFGVPSQNKMYIDAANPLSMGSGFNTSTSSPRFQHRVPMFVEGKPAQSSVDSSCENKTPKVRVIPIEIENDGDPPSSRHRTFSGPAGINKQHNPEICSQKEDVSTLKRSMEDLSKPSKMKAASGPRVYNIPIKVEPSAVKEKKTKLEKGKMPAVKPQSKVNGCNVSKHIKNDKPEPIPNETELIEEVGMKVKINDSLKKIDSVKEELKSYETGVNDFNGTAKDKQYRYLDEMLTRCMIKLDDIETLGNEEVRCARKKVVKMVQACIDLLESKVNVATNPDTSVNTNDVTGVETTEKQDNAEQSVMEENTTEMDEQCNMADTSEESKLLLNESLISDAPRYEGKPDVPEVEMVEVTSTSSDVNQKSGIDNSVTDELQSSATNTVSNEISTQPSEYDEKEMTDVTQIIPQDQKELRNLEVSSTNIAQPINISVDPASVADYNEAEMTDVSSALDNSSEIQRVEAKPEVSSSNIQPELHASNVEQLSTEPIISEQCQIMENAKSEEPDNSHTTNLQSSIPEVEMKEIVENSCETNNKIPGNELSNLQSKCVSNNGPN